MSFTAKLKINYDIEQFKIKNKAYWYLMESFCQNPDSGWHFLEYINKDAKHICFVWILYIIQHAV